MRYSRYPSYRDSGTNWLGEIPNNWSPSKLKYCLSSIIAGGTPKTNVDEYWCDSGDGIPWVSIADMTRSNIVNNTKKDVTLKGIADKGLKILPEGTILYSIFASLGKVSFAGTKLTTNQAILGLLPNHKIDKAFFYWVLIALEGYVKYTASSNTQDNLNSEKVANFPLVLPLQEQQTIANYLDKATAKIDTLIEKQTRLIELLKEKRQAVISTAVTRGLDSTVAMKDSGVEWLGEIPEGWEVWKMAHAFNTIGSGTTPSSTNESYYNGYIPWVTTGELRENTITGTKKLLTDEAIKDNSSLKLFPVNSIIIAMYGATIGRLGVLGIKATTNQACCVMTDSSSIKNEYLYYWLMGYRDEIIKLGYGGGQPNISQDTISNLKISAPSLAEQEQIVHYLGSTTSKVDNLIAKATKAIELLKEKRTALISSAVTGKIDVRNTI